MKPQLDDANRQAADKIKTFNIHVHQITVTKNG